MVCSDASRWWSALRKASSSGKGTGIVSGTVVIVVKRVMVPVIPLIARAAYTEAADHGPANRTHKNPYGSTLPHPDQQSRTAPARRPFDHFALVSQPAAIATPTSLTGVAGGLRSHDAILTLERIAHARGEDHARV